MANRRMEKHLLSPSEPLGPLAKWPADEKKIWVYLFCIHPELECGYVTLRILTRKVVVETR